MVMSRMTRYLLIGAVSAMAAAVLVVAAGSSGDVEDVSSPGPEKNLKLVEIDSSLERLERRIDDMATVSSDSRQRAQSPKNNDSSEQAARLSALERRIAELEDAPVAIDDRRDRPEPAHQTREELVEQTLNDWYGRLRDHDHETRDPGWAPEASASFESDLQTLAEAGNFDFLNTDCKWTTCTATVEFKNYDDALTGYESLLHHDYNVNCAREVLLPEPEDVQARYLATVLYDCSSSRADRH
jgi:hypothetical protein